MRELLRKAQPIGARSFEQRQASQAIATILEAQQALGLPIGYTTVQTRLNRLVKKGVATRTADRPARYSAAMSPDEVGQGDLDMLVERVSEGRVTPLVAHLLERHKITAEEIAETTVLAAEEIQRFGIEPKAALLSHSDFGSRDSPSALKMRKAADILKRIAPDLQCDGEMHADTALSEHLRQRVYPHSRLKGVANVLILPNLDAANAAYQMIKVLGDALAVGPILIGPSRPAHILTPSVTARGILNMTAVAVVEAQERATRQQPTLFG